MHYFFLKRPYIAASKLHSSLCRMSPLHRPGVPCPLTFVANRFIVTLAWILGKPLTLMFDPFQSIVLFLSGMSSHVFGLSRSNYPQL